MQKQREPFFKPFNTDQHSSEASNRLQNRTKVTQNTDQNEHGGERLNSLHARLHQEADKIRKWKNQAELEIKQKNTRIQESSKTIECLRKTILDLQLKNENLSMALQEEMGNREDILQRVAATRTLCASLKDHLTKAETKISQCEEEKNEIKHLEEDHKVQFEQLSENFNRLELTSSEQQKNLKEQVSMVMKEKTEIEERLKLKSLEAGEQLKVLNLQLDDKNIEIRDIRVQVQKNNEKIHTLEKDIASLTSKLQHSNEQLSGARVEHEKLNEKYNATEAAKAQLEQELCHYKENLHQIKNANQDLKSGLETTKSEHQQQLQNLKAELDQRAFQLSQKQTKVQCLEIDLEKANTLLEEVKSSKDILIMEKAELENRLRDLEKQNAELLLKQEENCFSMKVMSETIQGLQGQLVGSQQNGEAVLQELNAIKSQLQQTATEKLQLDERIKILESDVGTRESGIIGMQKDLADKTEQIVALTKQIEGLQAELETERITHKDTVTNLKSCKDQLKSSEKESGTKTKKIDKLQKEVEKLTGENNENVRKLSEMESTENTLREEIEELKTELTAQKETNESLLDEKQHNEEAVQGKLLTKEKAASDLEAKNKTLKADMAAKMKQIKELEKEIRTLKSKMTKENKTLETKDMKLSELESQLEAETNLKTELETELQEQKERMIEMQNSLSEAEKQAQESKEIADRCTAEKEDMHKQCEGQRTEMSAIMLNYKNDHEKSLQQKEKEIETLNSKIKTIENKLKKQMEDKEAQYQKEIEQLRNTVSKSGYQMESLQKNFGEKENKLQKLELENSKKDEELRSLQEKVENMYIKNSTVAARASPVPSKPLLSGLRTPQVQPNKDSAKTPTMIRTPSTLKTPQRSILKPAPEMSATKKRRVVFAANEDNDDSDSGESSAFELDLQESGNGGKKNCITPVLVKPSPRTPGATGDKPAVRYGKKMNTAAPPIRMSSSKDQYDFFHAKPAESGDASSKDGKKKTEKAKTKTEKPAQRYGKILKGAQKTKAKKAEKDSLAWFDNDDVFSFNIED